MRPFLSLGLCPKPCRLAEILFAYNEIVSVGFIRLLIVAPGEMECSGIIEVLPELSVTFQDINEVVPEFFHAGPVTYPACVLKNP